MTSSFINFEPLSKFNLRRVEMLVVSSGLLQPCYFSQQNGYVNVVQLVLLFDVGIPEQSRCCPVTWKDEKVAQFCTNANYFRTLKPTNNYGEYRHSANTKT